VHPGQIKGLIGPNGAGKTTLFNCICNSIHPHSGSIMFDGTQIRGMPPHRITQLGMSRTFQNVKLFARMNVLDNCMVGVHSRSSAGMIDGMLRTPRARREEREIRRRALEKLALVGITHLAEADAVSLSFGQQRAVEFARALSSEPKLLLLDEPAAGLNSHETRAIAGLITNLRDLGLTILIVEHDMSLIMEISDEIMVLSNGELIAEGSPRDIQRNAEVIRVYLGDDNAAYS
jgi:branched-chain amino acid transport system ATP-binding protein